MRKFFTTLALVGWFFAYRYQDSDVSGVMNTTITEGFQSREECNAYREELMDLVKQFGLKGVEFSKCAEKKAA